MRSVGIDIGSYSIKIAELDGNAKGTTLVSFQEIKLSPDLSRDRSLEIIETLRSLAEKYSKAEGRLVIAINQDFASVRLKRFPFRNRTQVLNSTPFELEDELPLEIDETSYDIKMIEFIGQAAEVLAVAVPNPAIEKVMGVARDGGLDADILTVEGLALANVYESWMDAPIELQPSQRQTEEITTVGVSATKDARMLVSIGHSKTLVLVHRESGLIAVRSIPFGGADVTAALAQFYSLPPLDAQKVLHERSFILTDATSASRDQAAMSELMTRAFQPLIHQLKLTMMELHALHDINFTRVMLTGGTSQIQNLSNWFSTVLEIPVTDAPHLQIHKTVLFESTPQVEAMAATAIGIALEGLKTAKNPPINFRRGTYARENKTLKLFVERWKHPMQIAAALYVVFFIYSFVRDSMAISLADAGTERLGKLAKEAAIPGGGTKNLVEKYIRNQNSNLASLQMLEGLDSFVPGMDILVRLSDGLPVNEKGKPATGLDIHRFELDNDTLTIEGAANNNNVIRDLEKRLNEIAKPKTVAPTSPAPYAKKNPAFVPFGFTMKVGRK